MKLRIIPVALLVGVLSVSAYAADVERAPTAEAKTDTKAKPMTPHSHVTDKHHIPQSASTATDPDKKDPWKDKTKHFHPRDGK